MTASINTSAKAQVVYYIVLAINRLRLYIVPGVLITSILTQVAQDATIIGNTKNLSS
jgi:hypothetical protein